MSLDQLLGNLWRRKLTILATALLCAMAGFVVAKQLPKIYAASGLLTLDIKPIKIGQGSGDPTQQAAFDPTVIRSESQVLSARSMVEPVVRQLQLDRLVEFNPSLAPPGGLAPALDGVKRSLRSQAPGTLAWLHRQGLLYWDQDPPPATDAEIWSGVVDRATKALNVAADPRSYIVALEFRSRDPEISQRFVNALMATYIAQQIQGQAGLTSRANGWLTQRIGELEADLHRAEAAVQDYRTSHGLLETKLGTVTAQQLSELNTQLSVTRGNLARAVATYEAATGSAGGPGATTAALASPTIQALRAREADAAAREADSATKLGPNHPIRRALRAELGDVRGRIGAEITRVTQSLAREVDAQRSNEAAILAQIATLQGDNDKVAQAQVPLQQLERDADAKREVYRTFLLGAQQTAQSQQINDIPARVVSPAVTPVSPASPRVGLIAVGAGLAGLLFAAALVLWQATRNLGFSRLEELERASGLPGFGSLPEVRRWPRGIRNLADFMLAEPLAPASETVRGIAAALRRGDPAKAPRTILVTSACPGEGKTALVTALARSMAEDGLRVLLIDADQRRPQHARIFANPPAAGLNEIARGEVAWTDAVGTDLPTGLQYLTASAPEAGRRDFLTAAAWRSLLAEASLRYDMVLIDSPPILNLADAVMLCDQVEAVLFVVRAKATRRGKVAAALRRLARRDHPGRCAVVLSRISAGDAEEDIYQGYAPLAAAGPELPQATRRAAR